MPSRNRQKIYVEGGYYHVYNRGVAKQKIFKETQDYKVFLRYLKDALTVPKAKNIGFNLRGRSFKAVARPIKNFLKEIELIAFCLMTNHFHLLLKQYNKNSMEGFMRSLITRYAQYFNKKYDRIGPVFQGRYKAILVTEDRYLLHLTRYIHLNPSEFTDRLTDTYSSYSNYLDERITSWIKPDFILGFFNQKTLTETHKYNNYRSFVEGYRRESASILGELTLE